MKTEAHLALSTAFDLLLEAQRHAIMGEAAKADRLLRMGAEKLKEVRFSRRK